MQREVQSAARRDRLRLSCEDTEMTVRGVVHGTSTQPSVVLEHESVVLSWIEKIRVGFADIVVRRTHKSVDNEGRQLFDLHRCERTTFSFTCMGTSMITWRRLPTV